MKNNHKNLLIFLTVSIVAFVGLLLYFRQTNQESFENESTNANTVYFVTNGRFGNNIFQYIAAELIRKKYNLGKVQYIQHMPVSNSNFIVISDESFIKQMTNDDAPQLDTTKGVFIMDGYFQRSDILKNHRSYILSLFNASNCNYINSKYRVCDIAKHIGKQYAEYDPDQDIVMHFRLDDFRTHVLGGLFRPEDLKRILESIQYRRLIIVCDTLKEDWEKEYMSHFADLKPFYTSGTMLDDWVFLRNAKRLILSQSTFAWTAAFLGNATELHIPQHPKMGPHTHFYLGCFTDSCKIYSMELL